MVVMHSTNFSDHMNPTDSQRSRSSHEGNNRQMESTNRKHRKYRTTDPRTRDTSTRVASNTPPGIPGAFNPRDTESHRP